MKAIEDDIYQQIVLLPRSIANVDGHASTELGTIAVLIRRLLYRLLPEDYRRLANIGH